MKRSDKVYRFVMEKTANYSLKDLEDGKGVTAADVFSALGIDRANASRDLNQLVREGLIVKGKKRPVKYVAHFPTEGNDEVEETKISKLKNDRFNELIGGHRSLKIPVEQAKAAILYPPNGLNCLITGGTGVGKSFFAKTMFEYAKESGLVAEEKKLVIFNCADYAHNSELLMSHLFGYVEGAFTGANKTKEGLIHEADNSFLFLDEVHRLPPEGQEMIFYFMDHGLYNRLGETLKNQKANVRIICATTEDPSSTLLNTFVRRIPINIQLPSFDKRTTKEKVDLATHMFAIEAKRIGKKIIVSADTMKALIGTVTFGNVGQLKSNVQLICARAFINNGEKNNLVIDVEQLPIEIKRGLSENANNRKLSAELSQLLSQKMEISPDLVTKSSVIDAYELPYDLYELIGEKTHELKEQGVSQEQIKETVMGEINLHLDAFYRDHGLTMEASDKLVELVDEELVELTKEIHQIASHALDYSFQINFIYALSLHISAFLRRSNKEEAEVLESNESIRELIDKYPKEYQVALTIKELIFNKYQTQLPIDEVDYLTLLIVSLKENYHAGKIGVIVAAHGDSTATSMVQVAKKLFGNHNIAAVDMPLDMKPRVALDKIMTTSKGIQCSSGLLLLVDMGSLMTFGDELESELGIKVRTLDMVTTSLVLEAARKTDLIDADLEMIYQSLRSFNGYAKGNVETGPVVKKIKVDEKAKMQAIVAVCASGKGAAERMKSLILEHLEEMDTSNLNIIPVSVLNMQAKLEKIKEDYQLLAVTGIVNPKVDVPFYSMEELLSGRAIDEMKILLSKNNKVDNSEEKRIKKLCFDYMEEYFTFINPEKVLPILWVFTEDVLSKRQTNKRLDYSLFINVIAHLAGSLERAIRDDMLTVEQELLDEVAKKPEYQQIKEQVKNLEAIFNINYSDAEIYYIYENISNTLHEEK